MIRLGLFVALLHGMLSVGIAEDSDEDWFANDSTKRLQEIIMDFRLNHEEVRTQRRAFVAKGTRVRTLDEEIDIRDLYFIGAFESQDTTLFANSYTLPSARHGVLLERWDQRLFHKGVLYQRGMPHSVDQSTKATKDKKKIDELKRQFVEFSPIAMSVAHSTYIILQGPPPDSDTILTAGKLKSCVLDDDHNVVQTLEFPGKQLDSVEVVYGKKNFLFPSSVSWRIAVGEKSMLTAKIETEWKKHGDVVLPSKVSVYHFAPKKRTEVFELQVEYRLSDELKGKKLVELKSRDWREPVRRLFDEDWQRAGVLVPVLAQNQNDKAGDNDDN